MNARRNARKLKWPPDEEGDDVADGGVTDAGAELESGMEGSVGGEEEVSSTGGS